MESAGTSDVRDELLRGGGRIYGEQVTGSSRRDYLLDALGAAIGTATSAGAAENAYRYKPYGAPLSRSGVAADPAFLWVGSLGYRQTGSRYADAYVRARHYATAQGRWTTKDPVSVLDGLNVLSYAAANPVLIVDLNGLRKTGVASTFPDVGCHSCSMSCTSTKRCKDGRSCKPEPCTLQTCVPHGTSGKYGARWDGDPSSASVAEYFGECMGVYKVCIANTKTGEPTGKCVTVVITDIGRFCELSDPGCRGAEAANRAVWPGKKRIIDLHGDAMAALGGNRNSLFPVVVDLVTTDRATAYNMLKHICFSSNSNAREDCMCKCKSCCAPPCH